MDWFGHRRTKVRRLAHSPPGVRSRCSNSTESCWITAVGSGAGPKRPAGRSRIRQTTGEYDDGKFRSRSTGGQPDYGPIALFLILPAEPGGLIKAFRSLGKVSQISIGDAHVGQRIVA